MTGKNDFPGDPANQRTSLLEFPCEFPVKVMGLAEDGFDLLVAELVRRHVPDLGEGAVSVRPSRGGRYISVTVTVVARSQGQLDSLYRELTAHPRVMMAL